MRAVAWAKEEPFGVEFAEVSLSPHRLSAVGVAVGAEPEPYRLDYTIETRRGFVTSRLQVVTRGQGWRRHLDLRRTTAGTWSAEVATEGDAPLPSPGGNVELLDQALDCDLGLSPLTNTMPVLRCGLLCGGGPVDLHVAWVSVPDLGVRRSIQRYTFVRSEQDRSLIRFEDVDVGFVADITFDQEGLVVDYPRLARRLPARRV